MGNFASMLAGFQQQQAPQAPQQPQGFRISSAGYGGGNLQSLGIDPSQHQVNNNLGLMDYVDPSMTTANVGGQTHRVQVDPNTGQIKLYNPADERAGAYLYDSKGNYQNWAPYMETPSWGSDLAQFGATAAGLGLGAGAMGFTDGLGYSGAGAAASGAASGAAGAAGGAAEGSAPFAFNAAADSQAANAAMGLTGADGAAGASSVWGLPSGSSVAAGGAGGAASAAGGAGGGGGASGFMGLSNGDIARTGASLGGAYLSSSAAKRAADTQAAATRDANARLDAQYNTTRNDLAPWRTMGGQANSALARALGLGANDGSSDFGSLNKPFTGADLASEPGYQFGLDQGMRALNNRAAAAGSYFSGAALKGAQQYAQDYAGTKYNDAFNRDQTTKNQRYNFLSGQSSSGQNAATQTGNFGTQVSSNIAGNTTALGNAMGASQIAQGNAWNNGISGAINNYQQNQLMDRILSGNTRW